MHVHRVHSTGCDSASVRVIPLSAVRVQWQRPAEAIRIWWWWWYSACATIRIYFLCIRLQICVCVSLSVYIYIYKYKMLISPSTNTQMRQNQLLDWSGCFFPSYFFLLLLFVFVYTYITVLGMDLIRKDNDCIRQQCEVSTIADVQTKMPDRTEQKNIWARKMEIFSLISLTWWYRSQMKYNATRAMLNVIYLQMENCTHITCMYLYIAHVSRLI